MSTGGHLDRLTHRLAAERTLEASLWLLQELVIKPGHGCRFCRFSRAFGCRLKVQMSSLSPPSERGCLAALPRSRWEVHITSLPPPTDSGAAALPPAAGAVWCQQRLNGPGGAGDTVLPPQGLFWPAELLQLCGCLLWWCRTDTERKARALRLFRCTESRLPLLLLRQEESRSWNALFTTFYLCDPPLWSFNRAFVRMQRALIILSFHLIIIIAHLSV